MSCRILLLSMVSLLAACSSVELPAERTFGLALPPVSPTAAPVVDVLRFNDLQLTGGIDRDHPMTVAGVERGKSEFDRWIAPVERLVTDALLVELSRRGVAELVKGAIDPGRESWTLHGRLVEFAAVRGESGNSAQVTVELWLLAGDRLLFRDEFQATESITELGTAPAVAALGAGLGRVAEQLEQRLRQAAPPTGRNPTAPGR